MCMMIRGAADRLWWMKIWCEQLKRRLERTDDSPLRHFPCIFLKFHGHFFTKLCLMNLKFRKLWARWVPKMLTEEHKLKRQASALDFLTGYSEEDDNFLCRVVTGDETWVSHATPESKQQSMEWRHTLSPTKTKFKQTTSTRKIMCTVFWDRKGVLLVDLLPQGSTIIATDLKKLRRAMQNKRRGMLSRGVVMIHDNARPHTAAATQNVITTFGWEQFDHPPYSPDLAPSDFHLFPHLKSFLAGQRFHNDNEIKEAVTTCFASQAAPF